MKKKFLTTKELMEYIGVNRSTIDRYVENGILIRYKLAGITRGKSIYKIEEVDKLIIPCK